ncbi:MAG: DUF4159 domain-containing protein [Nibricoccus sp.]
MQSKTCLFTALVFFFLGKSLLFGKESPADSEVHRGGLVGWARLATPDKAWALHSDQDPKLAAFIRSQTSLNIDPVWYTASPGELGELCTYPFIYVKDLTRLGAPEHLTNIQEYLRRGGFLCIDPCVNGFSPAQKLDLIRRHTDLFKKLFPDSVVRELADDHEIYRCYFSVTVHELYTPDMIKRGAKKPANIGMRGVFRGDRMIAIISITGLECGWPETPQRAPACMKMIVNSYIYAMTR